MNVPEGCNPDVVSVARARAERDVQAGIRDLRAALAVAPEWAEGESSDGWRPTVTPRRQILAGLLEHLERSSAPANTA